MLNEQKKTFIPWIGAGGPTAPPPPPSGGDDGLVFDEEMARMWFNKMASDPRQGREVMFWNAKLAAAACRRVVSMAKNHWVGHVDPDGHGPNWYVREEGYHLPDYYWDPNIPEAELNRRNYVESLAYGGQPPGVTDEEQIEGYWQGMTAESDPGHRKHLLGEDTFASQIEVGICVIFDPHSDKHWYHSIISAPPEQLGQPGTTIAGSIPLEAGAAGVGPTAPGGNGGKH